MTNVLKFGGTSMGSTESLTRIINILKTKVTSKNRTIIVVSAMSGVTDSLLDLAKTAKSKTGFNQDSLNKIIAKHQEVLENFGVLIPDILNDYFVELKQALNNQIFISEISFKRYTDYLASFGERMSATTLQAILLKNGFKAGYLDTREVIETDDTFGNAAVDHKQSRLNTNNWADKNNSELVIATGFIARSKGGATTTLGRGGSDYTAGLLANYLEATKVEIWTDVSGVLSTDPRLVKEAKVVKNLSYSEAFEVAYYGGKVLYPKTMEACLDSQISIQVKNTFEPTALGTTVSQLAEMGVKVVSRAKGVTIVEVVFGSITSEIGLLSKIFSWFAAEKIEIDVVTTSGDSVSFSCNKQPSKDLLQKLQDQLGGVKIWSDQEIVAVIGTDIVEQAEYSKILNYLAKIKPRMISMNTKNTNLTVVVDTDQSESIVVNLHKMIFEDYLTKDL